MMVKYSKPMVIVDQGLAEGGTRQVEQDAILLPLKFIRHHRQAEVIIEFS